MQKQSTSWGKVAKWYDELLDGEDTYQEQVIKPNLLRILNVQKDEEILDVGCGQGFFAREIAKLGAKVVGIDIGSELIKIAKEKSGTKETYLTLPAEDMKSLQDKRFNAEICILALQNIKDLNKAVSEMSRVVKIGGRVILVLNHPTFRIPTASFWDFDEKQNVQFRRIDKYLSEITQEVDMTQGIADVKKKKFTYSYHRPLQLYFKTFAKNNFAVTRLEEWVSHKTSDKGSRKKAEDLARKEIPLFMCLELKKM
jgi:ubiquinone/menaquinone biosynthesis C-methylase UbiE